MNIFFLDSNIKKCAEYHVDRHVVKMILEYGQLLSTAHRVLDGEKVLSISDKGRKRTSYVLKSELNNILYYAETHINHPCAAWVRESSENYLLLYELLKQLCSEYTHRYDKIHKLERTDLLTALQNLPKNIPIGKLTDIKLAMPDEYKVADPYQSYINYYNGAKKHIHSWKKRNIPIWIA